MRNNYLAISCKIVESSTGTVMNKWWENNVDVVWRFLSCNTSNSAFCSWWFYWRGILLPSKGQENAGGDVLSSPYSLSLKENECPPDWRELAWVTVSPLWVHSWCIEKVTKVHLWSSQVLMLLASGFWRESDQSLTCTQSRFAEFIFTPGRYLALDLERDFVPLFWPWVRATFCNASC